MEYFNVADIYGENVFNDSVMRERLPKKTYQKLKETISSPSEIKISEMQQYFESYYNKLPRKKAEETIMLLLGKNLCSEQEIREFMLI